MMAFKKGSLVWEGIIVSKSPQLEWSRQSNEKRDAQLRGVCEAWRC